MDRRRGRPAVDAVVQEIVELRRRGFRFIALADDNFYPVSLADLDQARRRADRTRLQELEAIRSERFALMQRLAKLPDDMVFFTQITMEAAEDPEFLDAMRRARIRGALVGVESVTPEGLKDVFKGFNSTGDALVERLQVFRAHGVHVLGSFIFGLPTDRPATFEATAELADRAGVTFAQFVMLTPFPGTVDFEKWERGAAVSRADDRRRADHAPLADSPDAPAESIFAAPGDVPRRDPAAHAGGVGSVLRAAARLGPLADRAVAQGTARLRADLEAVPADVCEHRASRPTRRDTTDPFAWRGCSRGHAAACLPPIRCPASRFLSRRARVAEKMSRPPGERFVRPPRCGRRRKYALARSCPPYNLTNHSPLNASPFILRKGVITMRLRQRRTLGLCLFLASLGWATIPIPAQSGASPTRRLSMRSASVQIGPTAQGGRFVDFAVVEATPRIFYAATATGGLWKTVNNGISFTPVFDNQPDYALGAVAVAQSRPDVIYVGTGEANNSRSTYSGHGVYKSMDGGQTWTPSGLPNAGRIGRIIVHPKNPDVVLVAASGRLYSENPDRGLYRSIDGGKTWTRTLDHKVDGRRDRRDRHGDGPVESAGPVRGHLRQGPPPMDVRRRRPRQRDLQVHGRGSDLASAHERTPGRDARPDRARHRAQ